MLWAHVGKGARLERVGCRELSHLMGYSEVEQLHLAPRTQHDVLWFQVAVENADPVHMVQRVRYGAQHPDGLLDREGSVALQLPCHGLTRHVFRREEVPAVGQAVEVVD